MNALRLLSTITVLAFSTAIIAAPATAQATGAGTGADSVVQPLIPVTEAPPPSRMIRDLDAQRVLMQALADAGGWPELPEDLRLEPGDNNPAVTILRQRLTISGDYSQAESPQHQALPPVTSQSTDAGTVTVLPLGTPSPAKNAVVRDETYYDESLANAVRRFQETHGLEVDAIVGRHTVATLNIPAARRVTQIRVNMERLAALPADLGTRHVLVNVPGFEAFLFDHGTVALRSRIIVGKDQQQTPQFSGLASQVVVNPYWNVPDSIARNEILPKLVENPNYLAEESMDVIAGWEYGAPALDPATIDWVTLAIEGKMPYRFRQRPGRSNALGRIKILFPNDHAVYLHDTPSRGLFNRRVRAFSHGCMRVDKVVELGAALLGPDWTPERLQTLIDSEESKTLRIAEKVPVHVTYLTAWTDPETGALQFRDDLYERDEADMQALARRDAAKARAAALTAPRQETPATLADNSGPASAPAPSP